jgi:hypothetical protein
MNTKIILGVIMMVTLGAITGTQFAYSFRGGGDTTFSRLAAPPAITGDNIYVAWPTNKTGNYDVMFRASNDKGQTFGDKINLSNTTDADSTRVEIDSDTNSVVVTWWETTETSDTPVMKVSNDFGKTFGPLLKLAGNGTIASGEVKPVL